jgi:hypothetical protein
MRALQTRSARMVLRTHPVPMIAFADERAVICDVPIGEHHWIVIGDSASCHEMRVASTEYAVMCRDESLDLDGFTPLHAALFNRLISAACAAS